MTEIEKLEADNDLFREGLARLLPVLHALKEAVTWIEDDRFDDEYIMENWYHDAKKFLTEKERI